MASGFVFRPVDFQTVRVHWSDEQKAQWLNKARDVVSQACHWHTPCAKPAVKRYPIDDEPGDDDDNSDNSDDHGHNNNHAVCLEGSAQTPVVSAVHVRDAVDRLAALVQAVSVPPRVGPGPSCTSAGLKQGANSSSRSSSSSRSDQAGQADVDGRMLEQLEAFLGKCLESQQAHDELLAVNKRMRKRLVKAERALRRSEQRAHVLEQENDVVTCYAMLLEQVSEGEGASTVATVSRPTSPTVSTTDAGDSAPSTRPASPVSTMSAVSTTSTARTAPSVSTMRSASPAPPLRTPPTASTTPTVSRAPTATTPRAMEAVTARILQNAENAVKQVVASTRRAEQAVQPQAADQPPAETSGREREPAICSDAKRAQSCSANNPCATWYPF
ncbi:hypothetical protein SPI_00557 [Niveomyces insectorum RCEF 264]|uniref:Uncharacterized protein n=1 Tax=Niveomyces insectorum RCEF 264 TaxID=1081102 RepID=A0A162JFY9_9HYPO|nr:hypothetical protein SPI_00557 [Niveomyces insectorum RCEF 264]